MSSPGNGNFGQNQSNSVNSGNIYATQSGNVNITSGGTEKRGPRLDSKVLLGTVLTDVIFFGYGMLSYTGNNSGGDDWRAGIFLFLLITTSAMIGRWIRRRM
jgi:hypothetical protein